jgi:hypothetical protein
MARGYLRRRLDGISYETDIAASARRIGVINAFSPEGCPFTGLSLTRRRASVIELLVHVEHACGSCPMSQVAGEQPLVPRLRLYMDIRKGRLRAFRPHASCRINWQAFPALPRRGMSP